MGITYTGIAPLVAEDSQFEFKSRGAEAGTLTSITDTLADPDANYFVVAIAKAVAGSGKVGLLASTNNATAGSSGNIYTIVYEAVGQMDGGKLKLVSPASWTKLIDADGIKHIALQTSGSASLTNETFGAATDSNTVTYDITTMRSGDRATFTYSGVTVDNLIDTDVNTTLSSGITAAATSISVASATSIVIGSTLYIGAGGPEQVTVTAIDATTATLLTVTRASNGTAAIGHTNGVAVKGDLDTSDANFQVLVASDDTTTPLAVTTDLDGVGTDGTTYVLPSGLVIGAVADGSEGEKKRT